MSRLVHEVYAPNEGGEATYATPDGGIVQVPQDFAFADTVVALEEDLPTAPLSGNPLSQRPSGPVSGPPPPMLEAVDEWGNPLYETRPRMYLGQGGPGGMAGMVGMPGNTPRGGHDPGLVTRARTVYERAVTNVESSKSEIKQLWSATYDDQDAARLANEEDPFVRLAAKIRRMRTLWSFFEWDRADLMRAAWIGVAVFVVVAMVGVFVLQR